MAKFGNKQFIAQFNALIKQFESFYIQKLRSCIFEKLRKIVTESFELWHFFIDHLLESL